MKKVIAITILSVLLAGFSALIFMTNFEDYLRIEMNEEAYFEWAEREFPYLKQLKELDSFHRRIDNYSEGAHVFPYVFYSARYGESNGIVEYTFTLNVNADFSPSGVHEGRVSVILLPAREQVKTRSNRVRNVYWGRYFDLNQGRSIANRIVAGESFSDLEAEIEEKPDYPLMRYADTDPWNHLIENSSNQLVESTETSSATH